MSDKLPNNNASEEVDLGQLFKAIGNLFDRFYRFIKSIFKSILSVIVYGLKAIIDNFKLIASVIIVLAILGVVYERVKPKEYTSSMLVRPYFDSKYQLIKNINYYNTLVRIDDFDKLSRIFEIEKDTIEKITSFEVNIAPVPENDKILKYEQFVRSIDSARAIEITLDDYVDNEDVYSGDEFEIKVKSYKSDIFKSLIKGINNSFTNTYSLNLKKKKDSLNFLQRKNIIEAINEVDSLQKVYIEVLEEESKSASTRLSIREGFTLDNEKSETKEFELLNREIQLRNQLRELEEQKVEEDVFFDVISEFQEVGEHEKELTEYYSIIFPVLGFIILSLLFLISRLVTFVKNYEG